MYSRIETAAPGAALAGAQATWGGLVGREPFGIGWVAPDPWSDIHSLGATYVPVRYDNLEAMLGAPPMGPLRRALDLFIAIAAIAILLPVFLIVAVVIKLQDGGPILFSQERIGRSGRRFRCFKFRSMLTNAEERLENLLRARPDLRTEWECTHKLKNDPRVTRFGDFLRRSSLDELPQLFNILRGEMSIVGPRPIVEAEIERYGRWFRYYTVVSPGLTGLWQISGRSETSYRRRVATDRLYVRMHSLRSYVLILVATIPAVLARRGAC